MVLSGKKPQVVSADGITLKINNTNIRVKGRCVGKPMPFGQTLPAFYVSYLL
jgi:hypothetical protein